MSEPTIRDAEPDDSAEIRRVARESWHAAYDDIIGPETVDETIDERYSEAFETRESVYEKAL